MDFEALTERYRRMLAVIDGCDGPAYQPTQRAVARCLAACEVAPPDGFDPKAELQGIPTEVLQLYDYDGPVKFELLLRQGLIKDWKAQVEPGMPIQHYSYTPLRPVEYVELKFNVRVDF